MFQPKPFQACRNERFSLQLFTSNPGWLSRKISSFAMPLFLGEYFLKEETLKRTQVDDGITLFGAGWRDNRQLRRRRKVKAAAVTTAGLTETAEVAASVRLRLNWS